ncbi:pyridoxamine 5'-phosphate oxidase [Clostridium tetani]|uniref:pyridoxamine 5'-phosphate oxidase family protein n=1 Tax=Clostridium tetani TaxID=1513 RepID=UPI00100BBA12|nr:pyridoxamine 5'-phosphate oxidase family protein [Clostridium tetani]RXI46454.1 pyridoxamine 5'-phosphate oxidase [Clostridium tetani]RXM61621.1 pyridoxamine 5'-phosphate oxidase [Clostridium tetani]RXM66319.1 pyridoxamine 5'-phosphate oxidase [Clostridium tetani]
MLREMRKKERSINISEAMEMLNEGQYGVLSVITNEGYPYGVPINYVYMDNCIYFHCAIEGYKLDSFIYRNNKNVFLIVRFIGEVIFATSKKYLQVKTDQS